MEPISYQISKLENFYLNYNKSGDLIVGATAFIESNQEIELTQELVRRALVYLQQRHPFLRAFYEENTLESKIFLKIQQQGSYQDKIEFEWLELSDDQSTRNEVIRNIERYTSKLIDFEDNNTLLWRYQVVSHIEDSKKKFAASIVIPAVITDGINIMAVLIESVNIINALLTNSECKEMKEELDISLGLADRVEKEQMVGDKQKETVKYWNEKPPSPFKLLLPEYFHTNEIGLNINLLRINKDICEKLIEKSKVNGISFNSFFNTSLFYALRQLYVENGLEFPKEAASNFAANLRFRYKEKLDFSKMGIHICGISITTEQKGFGEFKDIWEDSKYIDKLVKEKTSVETGSIFAFSHSEAVLNRTTIENDLTHENVSTDLALSNLGNYVNDNVKVFDGPFEIKEVYFGDSIVSYPNVCCACIFFLLSWRGEFMVRLSTNRRYMHAKYADRLMHIFEEIFHKSI